jgi:hypothetical protein
MQLLLVGLSVAPMGCPGMSQVMNLYGYTEIRPPSKFLAPGSLVWVRATKPFSAGIICTEGHSLGPAYRPMVSHTAALELRRATDRSFSLDADYLSVLRAEARFSRVHAVTIKLENPTLYEVVDTDVWQYVRHRSEACRQALAQRERAGYRITMVTSALRADVTYTVHWSHEVGGSVGASHEVLKELALELGAENAEVSERTITAKGLYWGIKDDAYLAHLGAEHGLRSVAGPSRVLPPEREVRFVATADVHD